MMQIHSSKTQVVHATSSEYYNSIASGYDALYGGEQDIKLRCLISELRSRNISFTHTDLILDVGCGSGISSDFFVTQFGASVSGIDPAFDLIAQNTRHLSEFVVGFAEELPFSAAKFDAVVSISAIQNFTNRVEAFSQMKRVAKEDAYFFLSFMAKGNPHAEQITSEILDNFTVVSQFHALNDMFFICRR
jgi:ubiquinone/menaquinone biosynthesis C-methylase UbiE